MPQVSLLFFLLFVHDVSHCASRVLSVRNGLPIATIRTINLGCFLFQQVLPPLFAQRLSRSFHYIGLFYRHYSHRTSRVFSSLYGVPASTIRTTRLASFGRSNHSFTQSTLRSNPLGWSTRTEKRGSKIGYKEHKRRETHWNGKDRVRESDRQTDRETKRVKRHKKLYVEPFRHPAFECVQSLPPEKST